MPPHLSHLLQPLDVGCFAPLKKAYRRQAEDLMCNTEHQLFLVGERSIFIDFSSQYNEHAFLISISSVSFVVQALEQARWPLQAEQSCDLVLVEMKSLQWSVR
ncbi:uncharacterized protein M421DRAFT_409684 [Didymella exigua CBS 183.55]|uniref:DDE-1 domain-containing protein n=1 Tax=Didymella exigua CBS 183.55 TaxID=1150837 RepID=A0A6A5R7S6_9PLEO|nr:uncharacterized protein M421DRAFT_409684 [Didymella exigua CBS 183.55]KAF1922766.1 hypothetical protein M421DRAFT_409684 [Didymella exigua CBS 183.55]